MKQKNEKHDTDIHKQNIMVKQTKRLYQCTK